MKIAIVGGGSYQWAPMLLRDIALEPALAGAQVVLYDIAPEPLALVGRWAERLNQALPQPLTVETTTDRATALAGADAVILSIAVGGLEAMRHDLEIPLRYGIVQTVGDTVGPGGLSRALRHIPVVVDLVRAMAQLCPDAWLLNLTNPMSALCRAAARAGWRRVIGLCHELFGTLRMISELLAVPESHLQVNVAGINHFIWILGLWVDGQDAWPRLRAAIAQATPPDLSHLPPERRPFADRRLIKFALFQTYGALPAAGDRHLAEFFPFFLGPHADAGRRYGVEVTTIEHRQRLRAALRARLERQIAGEEPIPLTPSREEVAPILAAIRQRRPSVHIMNLPNRGQVANLPPEVVVETLGVVDGATARGLAAGDLPPAIHSLVARHVVTQELTVEAALRGDRNLARQALLNDPLVTDFARADALLDDLLQAHRAYLPQFFDRAVVQ